MKTYKLEPRVAFHIWRPIINDNLIKHWFGKVGSISGKTVNTRTLVGMLLLLTQIVTHVWFISLQVQTGAVQVLCAIHMAVHVVT